MIKCLVFDDHGNRSAIMRVINHLKAEVGNTIEIVYTGRYDDTYDYFSRKEFDLYIVFSYWDNIEINNNYLYVYKFKDDFIRINLFLFDTSQTRNKKDLADNAIGKKPGWKYVDNSFDVQLGASLEYATSSRIALISLSEEEISTYVNFKFRDALTEVFADLKSAHSVIFRHLVFPPEYRQAGLSILNYFCEVAEQRYPDLPCTVQIEQDGQQVRMVIQTQEGYRDTIERTLEEYGLVISGQRQPAELFDNAVYVMRLENKLTIVEAELQQERRAYTLLQEQKEIANRLLNWAEENTTRQDQRIEYLEREVSELRRIVGSSLAKTQQTTYLLVEGTISHSQKLTDIFSRYLEHASDNDTLQKAVSTIQDLTKRILSNIDHDTMSSDDKCNLTQAAHDIQRVDHVYWESFKVELLTFFCGVASGVGGNMVTDFVNLLGRL